MKTIVYHEPLGPCLAADGTRYTGEVECRVSPKHATDMVRAMVVGKGMTPPSDEILLDDFICVHWATEVEQ